jgi:hypothetical protein
VDYEELNEETLKNRYPLLLIQETLLKLSKPQVYTKLNVRDTHNMIKIAEGDEWKMDIRTCYGLFESLVMPFGLTNAPALFQEFINDTLRAFLDIFCTAVLDNILIYINNSKAHKEHVRAVIQTLKEVGLYAKAGKCIFHQEEVKYLGLMVRVNRIQMDSEKVYAFKEREAPGKLKEVQAFLGFANVYQQFIRNYNKIVQLLTKLTKKLIPLCWSPNQKTAIVALKEVLEIAPMLPHFDYDKEIDLKTDVSSYVSAGEQTE